MTASWPDEGGTREALAYCLRREHLRRTTRIAFVVGLLQVVWGTRDPALKVDIHGEAARRAAGVDTIHRLPGKHFLQEDQAPAIADLVAGIHPD